MGLYMYFIHVLYYGLIGRDIYYIYIYYTVDSEVYACAIYTLYYRWIGRCVYDMYGILCVV